MKKLLALLLTLAVCIPCFSAVGFIASADVSEHVYMIITNPGQDMNTEINIGWHADEGYTNCFVEYTTADDTEFANAKKVEGTYDADAYKWFYDRVTLISPTSEKFTKVFLDYGVELKNLKSDTDYIYRVGDGEGAYSATYAFKTAGQKEFSILWTGDTHVTSEDTERELLKFTKFNNVVDYVESLAKYDIGLQISTGDDVACGDRYNFWKKFYEQDNFKNYVYSATVGNHDVYDSMMDDVSDYTSFWNSSEYFRIANNYPKNGYTQSSGKIKTWLDQTGYSAHLDKPSSELFVAGSEGMLEGKLITGAKEDTNGRAYWFIYNRILFIVFDYYAMTYDSEKAVAFAWADSVIEANKGKYDYLIASQHLYLFNGADGTYENAGYYAKYADWAASANVDMLICGDNHIYMRTDSLIKNTVNTDPEKGTYVIQAPAITNTDSYGTHEGPAGYALNRYACATYLGGIMIDVDSEGMHFTVATGTGAGDNMAVYETFTIQKKIRYSDKEVGYYETANEVTLYETTDLTSTALTTIPAGTIIEVYETNGIWCKIRYNGFSGWTRLSSEECLYKNKTPSTYEELELRAFNQGYSTDGLWAYDKGYTKGNGTIANGGWLFSGNTVFTAIKQEDGTYMITEINADGNPKNTTPLIDNGILLMCGNGASAAAKDVLVVGYVFTFDWANLTLNQATPGEENKEIVVPEFDLGDVNEDGFVDNLDAAFILKYDAGLISEAPENADVNDDGIVDNLDATKILKYDAGLIDEL